MQILKKNNKISKQIKDTIAESPITNQKKILLNKHNSKNKTSQQNAIKEGILKK